MAVVVNYMREHKIDAVLTQVLTQLLSQNQLPYNPHAGFHRALKVQNQAFELEKISHESITKALNMSTYLTDISYLAGIRKFTNVWGLSSVIKVGSELVLFVFDLFVDRIKGNFLPLFGNCPYNWVQARNLLLKIFC